MKKYFFEVRKQELLNMINERKSMATISNNILKELNVLEQILKKYTFEDRLSYKELLSHTIADSFEFNSPIEDIVERACWFDKAI